jgi:hypothetical protein
MKRLLALALLILAWRPLRAADADIPAILAELSEITGLRSTRAIRQESIDKEGLRRYLEARMKETVKPEELRAEETALKKFGFVPAEFDLKKTTIDLLTEQAAAFYDYRKKKLFVLSSSPSMMEQALLVHELAHALADQHFHLERYIRKESNDDGAIARMAVMEGQASWLMAEYLARRSGQSLKTSPALLEMMTRAETAAEQYPVLAGAPLYIQESLLFPYTAGIRFQHALVEQLGQAAFSEVFRNPPLSSQHILHPELYRKGLKPSEPPLPELKPARGRRTLIEGAIGEIDHSILLRQFTDEKTAARFRPAGAAAPTACWSTRTAGLCCSTSLSGPVPKRPPSSSVCINRCSGRSGGAWKSTSAGRTKCAAAATTAVSSFRRTTGWWPAAKGWPRLTRPGVD